MIKLMVVVQQFRQRTLNPISGSILSSHTHNPVKEFNFRQDTPNFFDLPFLDHMHDFNPANRLFCRNKIPKSKHWPGFPFDKSVVLLNNVIQVLCFSDSCSWGQNAGINGLMDRDFSGWILVNGYDPWLVLVAVCLVLGTIFSEANIAWATTAAASPGDMILVQGGTFQMGDTFGDSGCKDDKPVHQVTVRSFYIGKYDVTFGEYGAFCQATGRHTPGHAGGDWGLRPVFNVSWYDALDYCNWRSQQEGLTPCYVINGDKTTCDFTANGYRLPTEAEWEYAAKGGSQSKGYKYSGSNSPSDVAWYYDNSGHAFIDQNGLDGCQVHLVGRLKPNELGIYDMSGNVDQWCWDWYDKNYYQSSPTDNPTGPLGGSRRVARGGDFETNDWIVRTTTREFGPPSIHGDLGFRLVRSAQ